MSAKLVVFPGGRRTGVLVRAWRYLFGDPKPKPPPAASRPWLGCRQCGPEGSPYLFDPRCAGALCASCCKRYCGCIRARPALGGPK